MRLLVDGFWWFDGPPSNRMVVQELVREWGESHPDDELFLSVPRGRESEASAQVPGSVTPVPVRGHQHAVANLTGLPLLARSLRPDATFCQAFTTPVGRVATFMHDALFQSNPDWFTRAERLYMSGIPLTARRAATVFTSSRKEADLIRAHNPRLQRVEPVGLAVSRQLLATEPVRPPLDDELDGFLLSVGRLNVRKNLMFAIRAALRSGRVEPRRPLLVVGAADGLQDDRPPEVVEAVADGRVRFLGHVDDAQLVWLYRHADLFVYLSLDEGFGLPPLEAVSFGCPVLVSDVPIFREVVGDAGRFVSPFDVDAAAAAIADSPLGLTDVERAHPLPRWADTVGAIRSRIAGLVEDARPTTSSA